MDDQSNDLAQEWLRDAEELEQGRLHLETAYRRYTMAGERLRDPALRVRAMEGALRLSKGFLKEHGLRVLAIVSVLSAAVSAIWVYANFGVTEVPRQFQGPERIVNPVAVALAMGLMLQGLLWGFLLSKFAVAIECIRACELRLSVMEARGSRDAGNG